MTDEIDRKYHEVANIFPLLQGAEFEALKADVLENGLLEPITIDADGAILDGRNRHRACIEISTTPRFTTWNGRGSLVAFVVSKNLRRRHLDSSQCAVVALEILPMLEKEAKERQGQRTDLTSVNQFTEVEPQRATQEAAKLTGTNQLYVSNAKKLQSNAPDLLESVRSGDYSIPKAMHELTRRERRDAPPMPSDKYRVIYSDPPWHYAQVIDKYGPAERHYPTMKQEELEAMGDSIKAITEDNAVLFMWATSPKLEEALAIVKAWGFTYKASFIWDKVKHNYGHYNSVRHEFLLLCTRGSCTPDEQKLFDSVQTIERSDTHSQKPLEFIDIIDTLYTHGKRIELFARENNKGGWEVWGNEPTL